MHLKGTNTDERRVRACYFRKIVTFSETKCNRGQVNIHRWKRNFLRKKFKTIGFEPRFYLGMVNIVKAFMNNKSPFNCQLTEGQSVFFAQNSIVLFVIQ